MIKIMYHNSIEFPSVANLMFIPEQYNKSFKVEISPSVTVSAPEIRYLNISVRKCTFPDEGRVSEMNAISERDCFLDCRLRYTAEKCGCIPYSFSSMAGQLRFNKPPDGTRGFQDTDTIDCPQCKPTCEGVRYSANYAYNYVRNDFAVNYSIAIDVYYKHTGAVKYHQYLAFNSMDLIAAVLACVIVAGLFVNSAWKAYTKSPIVVNVETTNYPFYNLPFPAVTICPSNNVKRRIGEKLLAEYLNLTLDSDLQASLYYILTAFSKLQYPFFYRVEDYLKEVRHLLPQLENLKISDFMLKVLPTCKEVFKDCYWIGRYVDCCTLFSIQRTEAGFCYSFNSLTTDITRNCSVQEFDEDTTNIIDDERCIPRHNSASGTATGLEVIFAKRVKEDSLNGGQTDPDGIRVINIRVYTPPSGSQNLNPGGESTRLNCTYCLPTCYDSVFLLEYYTIPNSYSVYQNGSGHLDLYYKHAGALKYRRESSVTLVQLIVSFGSVMELFLGISILCGIELIYYFLRFLRALYIELRKERTEETPIQINVQNYHFHHPKFYSDLPATQADRHIFIL
ncbi:hypothetical protein C0J52_05819 [Blattella germanica]|nr:hypothetical protein C0J52_05819 [Blattella germanica]